jgi:hypothetical protein
LQAGAIVSETLTTLQNPFTVAFVRPSTLGMAILFRFAAELGQHKAARPVGPTTTTDLAAGPEGAYA